MKIIHAGHIMLWKGQVIRHPTVLETAILAGTSPLNLYFKHGQTDANSLENWNARSTRSRRKRNSEAGWLAGWLAVLFLDVRQDADAVGGARTRSRATHEDDGLVRLEQVVLVAEAHRVLQSVVDVLLPLRRLRLWPKTTHTTLELRFRWPTRT